MSDCSQQTQALLDAMESHAQGHGSGHKGVRLQKLMLGATLGGMREAEIVDAINEAIGHGKLVAVLVIRGFRDGGLFRRRSDIRALVPIPGVKAEDDAILYLSGNVPRQVREHLEMLPGRVKRALAAIQAAV